MSAAGQRMQVIDVPQPGGPEALVLAERPVPQPAPGEVLIEVAAAGLNRADILQRRGLYPTPPGAPSYPGLEVAGTIAGIAQMVRTNPRFLASQFCRHRGGNGHAISARNA